MSGSSLRGLTARLDWRRILPNVIAPVAALSLAALISSLVLIAANKDPILAFQGMIDYAFGPVTGPDQMTEILNKAVPYYLSAMAVAIGFRMGLFNIGVDGQYRLATLAAGAVGAASFLAFLPGPLRIVAMVITAMAVGAVWSSLAALLKVFRGVSEVISTIMLNFIGGSVFAYLLTDGRLGVKAPGAELVSTELLPNDSWFPGIPLIGGATQPVLGFLVVAVAVGIGYWYLLGRTRFGFDLRASGMSPTAAVASGVNAKKMVVSTMLISGAVAGLIGLPELLGREHAVTTSVGGLGFVGIAIALLGRNNPIGVALASLLWAFLDVAGQELDINEIPKEIIAIMQGVTVLAVVIAYELAARIARRTVQRRVGAAIGTAVPPLAAAGAPALPGQAGGPDGRISQHVQSGSGADSGSAQ